MKRTTLLMGSILTLCLLMLMPQISAVQQQTTMSTLEDSTQNHLVQNTFIKAQKFLQTTPLKVWEFFEFLVGLVIVAVASGTTLTFLGKAYEIPQEKIQTYFALYMIYITLNALWRHLTYGFAEL